MGLEEIQGDLHRYYDRLTSGICLIGMEPGEPILFVNKGMLKIYHCTDEADFYRFTGKRLLLAEDNDLNAEIATAFLQDMGFTVDRAVDGADCVDRYQHEAAGTYGLILMDIQMPNMDGYQATLAIRGLPDKEKAGIPIVAMTANAFAEDRQKAFNVGMNGHIAKPINTEILRETLRELL